MAIPEFTSFGILPPGHFLVEKQDIEERYLQNPNRAVIWEKFEAFLEELKTLPWASKIKGYYLDGGFTSNKPWTKDIDVVIDLSNADDATLYEAWFWILEQHDRLEDTYQVDAYPYHPRSKNDLRAYFSYVKSEECVQKGAPLDTKKGMLVYTP